MPSRIAGTQSVDLTRGERVTAGCGDQMAVGMMGIDTGGQERWRSLIDTGHQIEGQLVPQDQTMIGSADQKDSIMIV